MPTLNKLEYLDETKQQIKTALNQFGSGITDEDTFRSYASKIENIYNNWPKVTGTGESVTLNNTKVGKMQLNLKGNTSQEPSPNPSYPQNVHVVKGTNMILFNTINLYDSNTALLEKKLDDNGELEDSPYYFTSDFIEITGSTNYTYTKIKGQSTHNSYMCQYDENKVLIKRDIIAMIMASRTIETQANAKYVRISGVLEDVNITVLELGDKSTVYPITLPSNMEMCKIDDYADEFVYQNNTWYKNPKIIKHEFLTGHSWPGQTGKHFWWRLTPTALHNKGYMKGYIYDSRASGFDNMPNYHFGFEWGGTFHIMDTNATTRLEILNLLINANEVLYYVAKEEQPLEPIEDTTLTGQLNNIKNVMSYDNQTIITQANTDLPFIITASALMKGGN